MIIDMAKDTKVVDILLIEDNPGDVRLVREGLKQTEAAFNLHVAADGVEATDFLLRRGSFSGAPRPDIIILDLNLPRKSGREILKEVKSDERFKTIPVIVLTTSRSEDDIRTSYALHANSYIIKPVDLYRYFEVIKEIERFWFSVNELPPKKEILS